MLTCTSVPFTHFCVAVDSIGFSLFGEQVFMFCLH